MLYFGIDDVLKSGLADVRENAWLNSIQFVHKVRDSFLENIFLKCLFSSVHGCNAVSEWLHCRMIHSSRVLTEKVLKVFDIETASKETERVRVFLEISFRQGESRFHKCVLMLDEQFYVERSV